MHERDGEDVGGVGVAGAGGHLPCVRHLLFAHVLKERQPAVPARGDDVAGEGAVRASDTCTRAPASLSPCG